MKESIIFRIALLISTAVHVGGLGLFLNGNHPFLQNGFGIVDSVIVFEIGSFETSGEKECLPQTSLSKGVEAQKEKKIIGHGRVSLKTGSSGTSELNRGGVNDEYLLSIRKQIEDAKFYPKEARRRLIMGTVTLGFWIDIDGSLKDTSIIKSSGFPILDRSSKEIVLRASPFPKPPDGKVRYVKTTILFTLNSNTN